VAGIRQAPWWWPGGLGSTGPGHGHIIPSSPKWEVPRSYDHPAREFRILPGEVGRATILHRPTGHRGYRRRPGLPGLIPELCSARCNPMKNGAVTRFIRNCAGFYS
jgi:hypothetical protein